MKPPGRRVAIVTACLAVGVLGIAGWLLRRELVLWYYFAPLGRNAQGYLEYRHRQTDIVMVRLPGGTFWMGAQAKDPNGQNYDPDAREEEGPVHEVTLSPFMIGKFEVTQAEWKAVTGSNPSFYQNYTNPVREVSWVNVNEFGRRTGLSLPTEAQWEYACRAEFGICDMNKHKEWCADAYVPNFYSMPEAKNKDPVWRIKNSDFIGGGRPDVVFRGGSRPSTRGFCDIEAWGPSISNETIGFRSAWRW